MIIFLFQAAIGDYLGEKTDFIMEVLEKFVEMHDFCGLTLVQALRNFLFHFRLPGEAQKIDRIMECFAARFCEQNPGLFKHPGRFSMLQFHNK
jgi:cytohesin